MLNIVCVKQGDLFGPDYVNILFDMVKRNLGEGTEGRFICFTDNALGLETGIEAWGLPPYVKGWWSKLYLFRRDLFKAGERVIFFDLDTLIESAIDEFVAYDGPFAGLRDFYRPNGLGSGVMAWPAGWGGDIWERWNAEGRPEIEGGDQAWIETIVGDDFVRLQDRFPGLFCSFKEDCRASGAPPEAAVVCFHGYPKPHESTFEWVRGVWKIGGWTHKKVETYCNTEDQKLSSNIRHACSLPIPWLKSRKAHGNQAVIIGGGPSLVRDIPWIKRKLMQGATLFALNNTPKLLSEHGILAHWQVIMDARASNAAFISRGSVDRYLIASQCDPLVFAKAPSRDTVLWHAEIPRLTDDIPEERRDNQLITVGGGTTVLTRTMSLAYALGFRTLHLYGVDSSYEGEQHHAYAQAIEESDRPSEVLCDGQIFQSAPWMTAQVHEFQQFAAVLADADCTTIVHGDGLLPAVAKAMERAINEAA